MSKEDKMFGFCPLCMQNVEHTRKFSSLVMLLLDYLTLRVFRILRIGPFYCFQCESKTLYLLPVRRDAPTFDSETSTTNYRGDRNERGNSNRAKFELLPDGVEHLESVGNFLKSEHSLLMQERRSRNFTAKFRDATVMKILNGNASLLDVRSELGVNEVDLIRWIADLMDRKQLRIEELKTTLLSMQAKLPNQLHSRLETTTNPQFGDDGPVIEGQVTDK